MRKGAAAAWVVGVVGIGAVVLAAFHFLGAPSSPRTPDAPPAPAAAPAPKPVDAVAAPTASTVAATAAVSGRVLVGKLGEEPAAGARVEVFPGESGYVAYLQPLAKGECGADGRFRFEGLEKGAAIKVRASRSGLATAVEDATVGGDPVAMRLGTGATLFGEVQDAESKQPIAGARVHDTEGTGVITGADGAYRLEGVESGSVSVFAEAEGYADGHQYLPMAGRRREKLVILLTPASSLAGVVLDTAGKPAPGATVTVSGKSEDGNETFHEEEETGEDGTFVVEKLRCGMALRVSAKSKDALAPEIAAGPLEKGKPLEGIVLKLEPAGVLVVTVVDESGRPVEAAGAEAGPVPGDGDEDATDPQDDIPMPAAMRVAGMPGSEETDASGKARLGPLAPGRYRVSISKEDFLPAHADADSLAGVETAVAVKLVAGTAITGTVVDADGKPVEEADVNVFRYGAGEPVHESRATAEDGTFRVAGLEGKGFGVSVNKEGFVEAYLEEVDPAAGPIKVVLPRGGAVAGVVVDEEGKPVPSFRVAVATEAEMKDNPMAKMMGMDEGTPTEFEDPTGRFRVDGLAPGSCKVTVRSGEFAPGRFDAVKVETGATVELKVVLTRGIEIRGIVVRKGDGSPVAGASVSIRPPGMFGEMDFDVDIGSGEDGDENADSAAKEEFLGVFGGGKPVRTDADGRFTLKGLEAGKKINVSAKAKGFAPASRKGLSAPMAEELRIEMAPGAILEGTVYDAKRAPKAGAQVMLQKMPATMKTAQTDAGGRYRIEGLAPGTYLFYVMEGGGMMARGRNIRSESVKIEEGTTVVKDYRFGEGTKLVGRVTRGGKPVAGTMVAFLPGAGRKDLASAMMGGGGFAMATTDEEGDYEITGIAPGVYTAMVQAGSGGGPAPGDAVEIRPGATEVRRDIALPVSVIRGVVVDAGGAAVPGANVQAVATGRSVTRAADLGEAMAGMGGETTSGPEGKFALEGVNPGSYTLRVFAAGKGVAVIEDVSPSEQGTEVRVVLDRGVKVTVRVVDAEGKPVSGAGVYATNAKGHDLQGNEMMESFRTGDDGRVEMDVPAGETRFEAVVTGHAPGVTTATAAAGAEVVVTLPRGATLEVLVTGTGGVGASGAAIRLLDATGNPYAPRVTFEGLTDLMTAPSTGTDGRYSRADLPAGRYTVRVVLGERTAEEPVTLVAGEKASVTVRLP